MKILQSLFLTLALSCSLHATTIQDLQPELIGIIISYLDEQSHDLAVDSTATIPSIGEPARLRNCCVFMHNSCTSVFTKLLFKPATIIEDRVVQKIQQRPKIDHVCFNEIPHSCILMILPHLIQSPLIALNFTFSLALADEYLNNDAIEQLINYIIGHKNTLETLTIRQFPNDLEFYDLFKNVIDPKNSNEILFPAVKKLACDYAPEWQEFFFNFMTQAPACTELYLTYVSIDDEVSDLAETLMLTFCTKNPTITKPCIHGIYIDQTRNSLHISPTTVTNMQAHPNFQYFCQNYRSITIGKNFFNGAHVSKPFFKNTQELDLYTTPQLDPYDLIIELFDVNTIKTVVCKEESYNRSIILPNCTTVYYYSRYNNPKELSSALTFTPKIKNLTVESPSPMTTHTVYHNAVQTDESYSTVISNEMPVFKHCINIQAPFLLFINKHFLHMFPNVKYAHITETYCTNLVTIIVSLILHHKRLEIIDCIKLNALAEDDLYNQEKIQKILSATKENKPYKLKYVCFDRMHIEDFLQIRKTYKKNIQPKIAPSQEHNFAASFPQWKYTLLTQQSSSAAIQTENTTE